MSSPIDYYLSPVDADDDGFDEERGNTVTSLGLSSADSLNMPANVNKAAMVTTAYASRRDGLFRLIRSDLFDVWLGLAYLNKFRGETVGTHYWLCDQLRSVPLSDVEFVLPQLL